MLKQRCGHLSPPSSPALQPCLTVVSHMLSSLGFLIPSQRRRSRTIVSQWAKGVQAKPQKAQVCDTLIAKKRFVELDREFKLLSKYFIFSEVELLSFILCLLLDISEYVTAILLMPGIGDVLDIAGIVACLLMFRWIGTISLFELVPGADVLPIFIITWLAWYLLKKTKKVEQGKLHRNTSPRKAFSFLP